MNTIKVMIVDDEILAITHLKHLISWKEFGFEIVADTTFPHRAMELFRKHAPQVIFLDIKMPGMDGLEFSKWVLQSGIPAQIVLLTSYKEFEYAKEAVKLGVFDYLLKHELHQEELISVLQRIRGELEDQGQKEGLIRQQLFNDLYKGFIPNSEQSRQVLEIGKRFGNQFVFFLMRMDVPVPVVPYVLGERKNGLFHLDDFQTEAGFHCLALLALDQQQWGFIWAAPKQYSYTKRRNELLALVRQLQKTFKVQRDESVSVTFSPLFHELTDIHRIYGICEQAMQLSHLFGRESIIEPEAASERTEDVWEEVRIYAALAANQLEQRQTEQVCMTVTKAFDICIKGLHTEEVKLLCRELVGVLEAFRTKRRMRSLTEKLKDEGETGTEWYTFVQISRWFVRMFRETICESERMNDNRYSWKVRQTLNMIGTRYHESLTIENLAEELGISGDRLRHLFKEETGLTVLEYLTQIRIQHAKKLLMGKRLKIYEIAEKVGYKNSQYFSQVFRRTVGVNPLDYSEGKEGADEA